MRTRRGGRNRVRSVDRPDADGAPAATAAQMRVAPLFAAAGRWRPITLIGESKKINLHLSGRRRGGAVRRTIRADETGNYTRSRRWRRTVAPSVG
jgi:hypothetical protein